VWDASGVSLFMKVKLGDTFSTTREVTDELIRDFARLSGDYNPIHLDDRFARSTRFGQRIAHGMLNGAIISAVLGNEFEARKIVYLGQTMRFTAPTFIGDIITTTATVTGIRPDKQIITLSTECRKASGEVTVTGESKVMILE